MPLPPQPSILFCAFVAAAPVRRPACKPVFPADGLAKLREVVAMIYGSPARSGCVFSPACLRGVVSSCVCAALCWFVRIVRCVPAGVPAQRAIGDDLRLGQVAVYFKLRLCDSHSLAAGGNGEGFAGWAYFICMRCVFGMDCGTFRAVGNLRGQSHCATICVALLVVCW